MLALNLRPLSDVVEEIRREARLEARRAVKAARQNAKERVEKAERTRQALALLDGAGIEVACIGVSYAHIDLGFFPSTPGGNRRLAAAVRQVRDALGCRLEVRDKDVADAKKKTVSVTLKPVDFPTIRISYCRKLPKGAKCRIVRCRSSYASLVCEV